MLEQNALEVDDDLGGAQVGLPLPDLDQPKSTFFSQNQFFCIELDCAIEFREGSKFGVVVEVNPITVKFKR